MAGPGLNPAMDARLLAGRLKGSHGEVQVQLNPKKL
jgi:hypothetical protein